MTAPDSIDLEIAALNRRQQKLARLIELRSRVERMEDAINPIDVPIATIQRTVAKRMSIAPFEMVVKGRCERIAWPRQIAMYLARKLTGRSLKEIGAAFGGRDHGTVSHACALVSSRLTIDRNGRLATLLNELELACNNCDQPANNEPIIHEQAAIL